MTTVLLVEDEDLIRRMSADQLTHRGFVVLQAADAGQAIAVLEARQDIHLLFTDIDMPGTMDGLRLAAVVRTRWPRVPIIVTSGKIAAPPMPERAVFIPKPYRMPNLVQTINALV